MQEARHDFMKALLAGFVLFWCAACASPTPTPTATPTAFAPSSAKADEFRGIAFGYWEAFNAYDPEATLAYLEESYRALQDEVVRGQIGQVRRFGVKLGVSEESAPQMIRPNVAEMYLGMREPLGTRRIRMEFLQVGEEWKLTFAEEVM